MGGLSYESIWLSKLEEVGYGGGGMKLVASPTPTPFSFVCEIY